MLSRLQACQDRSSCDAHGQTGNTTCCLHGESSGQTTTTSVVDPAHQRSSRGHETRDIRSQVSSSSSSASAANGSLVVLLSRRWSRNGGRRLLNEKAVLEYLVGRYGRGRVARFGDGRVDLTTAGRVFARAAAVVGVHGGAFYNVMLAPRGCVVVELMPLIAAGPRPGHPPRRLAHTIIWRLADALGHTYWRLYALTASPRSDVTLPVDKLRAALADVA